MTVRIASTKPCSGPGGLVWAEPGVVVEVENHVVAAELLSIPGGGFSEVVPEGGSPVLPQVHYPAAGISPFGPPPRGWVQPADLGTPQDTVGIPGHPDTPTTILPNPLPAPVTLPPGTVTAPSASSDEAQAARDAAAEQAAADAEAAEQAAATPDGTAADPASAPAEDPGAAAPVVEPVHTEPADAPATADADAAAPDAGPKPATRSRGGRRRTSS